MACLGTYSTLTNLSPSVNKTLSRYNVIWQQYSMYGNDL